MRTITFKLLTQVQVEKIQSNARTFGELKEELLNGVLKDKINFEESIKFIEKSNLTEYGNIPEAILPAGDCLFFVTPVKNKAGMDILSTEQLSKMGYNELRAYGSALYHEYGGKIDMSGKKVDVLENIINYANELASEELDLEIEENTEVKIILLSAISLIERAIGKLKENNYVEGITYEELEVEALRLKNLLN